MADELVAKLDKILELLQPKNLPVAELKTFSPGVDWKSVFISWAVTVILIGGLYAFKLKDVASYSDVENGILKSHENCREHCMITNERLFKIENDVKKLKEHRIGQVGAEHP